MRASVGSEWVAFSVCAAREINASFGAEGGMKFAGLFGRQRSATTAQHRLQVLLMHERCAGGNRDLIPMLHEDILAAVHKHVTVDADKVRLKIERGEMVSLLEIDIEIPT
jgi:cell division topological specificity factor